mmetsp:Transcript_24196/g.60043  ORF Transcript_24196/g.60043 Transcript_24196/m.60043 type:complete len:203 (+) Transcript_24196:560-1168(+)
MPTRAVSGRTRSATEDPAAAHASRSSARSSSVYSAPPTRLAPHRASTARAAVTRSSRCDGGQYPSEGGSHHGGGIASSAAAFTLATFASSFRRSIATFSDSPPEREMVRSSPSAFPRVTLLLNASSTHTSRPPSSRSLTHLPGPEPRGFLRRLPPPPRPSLRLLGSWNPPGPPRPNTCMTAHAMNSTPAHPSTLPTHGACAV